MDSKRRKVQNDRLEIIMKNTNILTIFSEPTVTTTENIGTNENGALVNDLRVYYSDYLIDNAEPALIHAQFGQKRSIPKNGGKTVEFRRYSALPKASSPLTEGITPAGTSMEMSAIRSTVYQYGAYIELSDMLLMTALDNNVLEATKLLGSQAGRTIDSVIRDVLVSAGTNVQYGEGSVDSRLDLIGGESAGNHYLTVDAIRRAARALKAKNVEKINGSYVAIIHPDVAYDLMNDPEWEKPKSYCDPEDLYNGEIGKIGGVRFVESSEAKVISADTLVEATGAKYLSITGYAATTSAGTASFGAGSKFVLSVSDTLTEADAEKLIGKKLQLFDESASTVETVKVCGANTADGKIFLESAPASSAYTSGDRAYAANAGRLGRDVYCTLVIGANAYGVIDILGGGLEHIVKQLGSAGTGDPINQRATVGWKAAISASVLAQEAMIRIETASTFESGAN